MTTNEYLKTAERRGDLRKPIKCADGFTMSVQASDGHYCSPRTNADHYEEVEVGFPSQEEPTLMPYAEDPETPTKTVYGYVPVEIIDAIIESHGGIA